MLCGNDLMFFQSHFKPKAKPFASGQPKPPPGGPRDSQRVAFATPQKRRNEPKFPVSERRITYCRKQKPNTIGCEHPAEQVTMPI
jgi:hypothetical protein